MLKTSSVSRTWIVAVALHVSACEWAFQSSSAPSSPCSNVFRALDGDGSAPWASISLRSALSSFSSWFSMAMSLSSELWCSGRRGRLPPKVELPVAP